MKRNAGDFFTTIDLVYGAAANDRLWPEALAALQRHLDGCGATLFFTDDRLRPIDRFFGHDVTDEAVSSYKSHYHDVNIRLQRAVPNHLGRVVTDGDLVDRSIIDRHEFYQDFLRPIGHRYFVSMVMDLGDGIFAILSVPRGLRQEHAGQDTLERAARLMPHVRRSLQLRRRFAEVESTGQAALETLDQMGQAVVLIGRSGRIVWMNRFADRLIDQRDGLLVMDGELRAKTPQNTAELHQLIRSASQIADRLRVRPGGMMTIERPSLTRAYQLLVTPLPGGAALAIGASVLKNVPVAAVFIVDPETNPAPRAQVLARLYNLTPAEARLATALASGTSIRHYAEQGKLSIHYVRWLLKQVEAKTCTRRIADLIRLLTSQTVLFGKSPEDD